MLLLTTNFGMPFLLKVILQFYQILTALHSNPIAPFTANTIGENNPFSIYNMRSLYILIFYFSFFCSILPMFCVRNPYINKYSLVWNPKISCTEIKPCFVWNITLILLSVSKSWFFPPSVAVNQVFFVHLCKRRSSPLLTHLSFHYVLMLANLHFDKKVKVTGSI